MIDTDKYEGHNLIPATLDEGHEDFNNWDALQEMGFNDEARQLIADAPDLLAEVKRLQKLVVKGSDDYTTSYMDLRKIIEDVHWALTGDDAHYSQSDGVNVRVIKNDARITYALGLLSEVIE